ncbi:hypothetical protein LEMLEM_LOCUS8267 [Lemmus lemmus]
MIVERPSARRKTCSPIRRFTLERNLLSAKTAGKPSSRSPTSSGTRELTQGRNPSYARSVGKPSVANQISLSTRKFILVRSLLSVITS